MKREYGNWDIAYNQRITRSNGDPVMGDDVSLTFSNKLKSESDIAHAMRYQVVL